MDVRTALNRRETKLKRLIGLLALKKAKEEGHPSYKKFKVFRRKWKEEYNKILKVYGPKVRSEALKILNKQNKKESKKK